MMPVFSFSFYYFWCAACEFIYIILCVTIFPFLSSNYSRTEYSSADILSENLWNNLRLTLAFIHRYIRIDCNPLLFQHRAVFYHFIQLVHHFHKIDICIHVQNHRVHFKISNACNKIPWKIALN